MCETIVHHLDRVSQYSNQLYSEKTPLKSVPESSEENRKNLLNYLEKVGKSMKILMSTGGGGQVGLSPSEHIPLTESEADGPATLSNHL